MSGAGTPSFEANLAAVGRRFPELEETVRRLGEPAARVVGSAATGDLNLDLGHTLLYHGDAASFAETQIERFRDRPGRIYMDPPARHDPPGQQQYAVSERLYAHFAGRTLEHHPSRPTKDPGGFLLIYGIGLGLHLPALFAETPVRHFILVEEHLEFFRHSLSLVDWVALLDAMEAKGQTLHFIFGRDSGLVSARVHWHIRGRNFGLIDGSYLFRHYSSAVLDGAHQDFVKNLPLLAVSIGFFEDELVMLANATENLIRRDFRHLAPKPRLEKDVPAFIVGSGPSLDRTIEHVKRLSGEAVIFSSGTALLALLRNGIRPDFHCELENGYSSVEHLELTRREFDLDGITLVASATVHPAMCDLFGERILYFRDSVCSTPLWCPDGKGLHGTAPTCTNLALRAALIFAFRDIYLFGVDLGTRDAAAHHTRDAIYHTDPAWHQDLSQDPLRAMTIEMPGNFGGKAYTNQILHWARMMMVQAIETFSTARIFNCSDGVSVPGTLPKLAQTIRPAAAPGRKPVVLRRLGGELDPELPGEMAPQETLRAFRAALARHYEEMREEIAAALADGRDFIGFYTAMLPFLEMEGPKPFQPVLRSVNIGMVMMCFQIGYYFYRRVAADEQPVVMRVFLEALDERLGVMAGLADAVIDRLDGLYPAA